MTRWPPLPKTIQGLAGPIRVLRPVRLDDDDWGGWHPEERVIRVRSTLNREVAWHTMLHELTHAMLDDSGLPMPDSLVEIFCDTNASAMLHSLRILLPTTDA